MNLYQNFLALNQNCPSINSSFGRESGDPSGQLIDILQVKPLHNVSFINLFYFMSLS